MLGYSMGHNVYVPTQDRKETARGINVTMVVQETVASRCAEGLDTSISSTLMPTKPLLMIGAAETQHKTSITKNGTLIWALVTIQVSDEVNETTVITTTSTTVPATSTTPVPTSPTTTSTTTDITTAPACFSEDGFDYYGSDVKSTVGTQSIDDCRAYCRENCESCTHFTRLSDTGGQWEYGACWCKTSIEGRKSWENNPLRDAITSGEICPE